MSNEVYAEEGDMDTPMDVSPVKKPVLVKTAKSKASIKDKAKLAATKVKAAKAAPKPAKASKTAATKVKPAKEPKLKLVKEPRPSLLTMSPLEAAKRVLAGSHDAKFNELIGKRVAFRVVLHSASVHLWLDGTVMVSRYPEVEGGPTEFSSKRGLVEAVFAAKDADAAHATLGNYISELKTIPA